MSAVVESVVILDGRAGSGELYADLLSRTSGQAELGMLDAGDVMGSGYGPAGVILWGIEVKKLSDALACMQDGRLAASQLPRMHEYYDYVFLLIEEDMRVDPANGYLQKRVSKKSSNGKWSEWWVDVLYGARERVIAVHFFEWLMSLQITGGARLLISHSREETIAWIVAVWKTLGKEWDRHKSLKVFDTSHPPRFVVPSTAAKVAKALAEGIGWEKAMAIGEALGSAVDICSASTSQLRGVPGIDTVLADRLFAGAREVHRHVVKRGTSFGGVNAARPHGNVLPASRGAVAQNRRTNRSTVSRSKQNAHHGRTGKRK